MGYCSCGNWVDEGGICEHCGSAMTYDADEEKYREAFDYYEYYYRQAKTSSIKGDHSAAIKFYLKCVRIP